MSPSGELRGRRKVCKERGLALRLFFPNSTQTPSTDLELRGHPVHPTPWVQTRGFTGTSSPLASGPKQRHSLLLLLCPWGTSPAQSTQPSTIGTRQTEIQTKNADCSVPEPCRVQTHPDCDHPSKQEVPSHVLSSPTEPGSACAVPLCLCWRSLGRDRRVLEGRAGRWCCLTAGSPGPHTCPMKRSNGITEAECPAE